jgi:hypothetical protein
MRTRISILYKSNVRKPLGVLTRRASWKQQRMSEELSLPQGWDFAGYGSIVSSFPSMHSFFIQYEGSKLSLHDAKTEIHNHFKGLQKDSLIKDYRMHIYSE